MKGLKAVANKTKSGRTELYYSIKENKAYTESGDGRHFLTILLTPHTPKMIEDTVHQFMNL